MNSSIFYSQAGINTTNPSAMLDIVSSGNTDTTKAFKVNNSNSKEMVTILNNGNIGINVQNPVTKLHTSGSIRMSGIDTNSESMKVMTTDISGNVTTRSTILLLPQALAGANGTDAISATQTLSSINGIPSYTNNLFARSFTISQTSLVTFSYQLGVGNIINVSGNSLTDGASKQIGARLTWQTLPAGSTFTLNGVIHTDAMSFMNSSANYTKEFFYPRGNCTITLSPGTYSVELKGYVYAFDNDQGIRATFGGSPYDRFDVIATSLQ
ncbi:hypothetical protein FW781_18990 [Chryseobacterium panacisoli]|uniref:Uncharacterized protein n=1 Tax=Chryseobacterium panacisoli TaxID=1807141 RepID=A0A5D8ZI50_9FLAO|nr:hypothetical protein [Chryseobacterium panacisoli]TZF93773.1 hypothetical protein FW781_18990 [Chryseobacterium panacisoli]